MHHRNALISVANPADRADGNRKQRRSRALIGISVRRRGDRLLIAS